MEPIDDVGNQADDERRGPPWRGIAAAVGLATIVSILAAALVVGDGASVAPESVTVAPFRW